MEKKLNSRAEQYITKFKDDIRAKLIDMKFAEKPRQMSSSNIFTNMND